MPTIANPYNPSQRRMLSDEEVQAFDPVYRKNNPELAVLQEPKLAPQPRSMPYFAGRMLASGPVQSASHLLFNHGAIPGALMTGGAAYGGGKLADWLLGLLGHDTNIAPWAAAAGAGIGGLLGHMRAPYVKTSSFWNMGGDWENRHAVISEIMQRVSGSPGLSPADRVNIRAELDGLRTEEVRALWDKIKDMAPFAIGAFLSHVLFGTGLMGSAAGGLLTQAVANQYRGRNSAGAPVGSIF